jgi:GNAT superfamily N-acetyltransferase
MTNEPPPVTVRPAEPRDAGLILAMIKELAEYERLADKVVATEESLRATLFGPQRAAEALIAEAGGKAVGFASFFVSYSTFLARSGLYMEDIYVRPAVRGQGIGRRLLVEVASRAVARGCHRLEWAVLDWNEPAIGFYQRLGAKPLDEWTTYRLSGEALERLAMSEAS